MAVVTHKMSCIQYICDIKYKNTMFNIQYSCGIKSKIQLGKSKVVQYLGRC